MSDSLAGVSQTSGQHSNVMGSEVKRRLEIGRIYDRHLPIIYAPAISALCEAFRGGVWFVSGWMGSRLCYENGQERYLLFNGHVGGG